MDVYVASALSVRARACHASARVSQAEITIATAVSMNTTAWTENEESNAKVGEEIMRSALDCQISIDCSYFTLRPAALALLSDQDPPICCHNDEAIHRLRNILQQSTIPTTAVNTIQDIIQMAKQARLSLLQLTPCRLTRAAFKKRCRGDPLANVLYKVVREAVAQYRDYEDYYFAHFRPDKVISGFTPPPFPNYDHDVELDELSYKFCGAESSISRIHKMSPFPIPAGYSCECVGILCHALEAPVLSPIGINLLTIPPKKES